jgi:uncharacterized OsmC-like protein
MNQRLAVEALDPNHARSTSITWFEHDFTLSGDNHREHGGSGSGPDGFDLLAAALGQCLLSTLLAKAQHDGIELASARAVVGTKVRVGGAGSAPVLSDLVVDIHLAGAVDEGTRRALEEHTRQFCGVRATLESTPNLEERVHIDA